VSVFVGLLNRTLAVTGFSSSGSDGGGQPTGSYTSKGSVKGRIDHKVRADEINGPDLNPIVSEYLAITELPVGFEITERDLLTDSADVYEVLGIARLDGRAVSHHLEMDLRKITA
jgi:hypothetical protein